MLNEIILQGRLTDDAELKITNSGKYVTSFSLAVERDFSTGDEKETDFINIVAWNKTAEFITKYFTKGKQMIVKGSLQVRKYQTQNGENRHSTEVLADKVYFCGDKAKDPLNELSGKLDTLSQDDFTEVSADDDLPF
jgi:single-strand DNA-binding protein